MKNANTRSYFQILVALIAKLTEPIKFRTIRTISCDSSHLRNISSLDFNQIFHSQSATNGWHLLEEKLAAFPITDKAGGVNPGDRRALYYLMMEFRPKYVLEIGTHVGASTVYIASALEKLRSIDGRGEEYLLDTVDIVDVNDIVLRPWRKYGAEYSPAETVKNLGYANLVKFHNAASVEYLSKCRRKYDLVFLDGSHLASVVYQEVALSLRLLNEGALIILHDYFPDLKPLWENGAVCKGPVAAIQRLQMEDVKIKAMPLGRLPWQTKLKSNMTSLAVLGAR